MRWYRRFFRRQIAEKQMDAELRFHLEQQIADYVAAGFAPEEARRRARLEFGGLDQTKEECREVGAAHFLETLAQDVRFGLRMAPSTCSVSASSLANCSQQISPYVSAKLLYHRHLSSGSRNFGLRISY